MLIFWIGETTRSRNEYNKVPTTLIRFQTKTELFCCFKKICVRAYRFRIVFSRPHYSAVSVLKLFYTLSTHAQMNVSALGPRNCHSWFFVVVV